MTTANEELRERIMLTILANPNVSSAERAAGAPVALAAGVETCIGTIATALGSVGAMLTASPAPPATNFTTFAAAAGPILTGITGALAPELLLVPTKTTTAT